MNRLKILIKIYTQIFFSSKFKLENLPGKMKEWNFTKVITDYFSLRRIKLTISEIHIKYIHLHGDGERFSLGILINSFKVFPSNRVWENESFESCKYKSKEVQYYLFRVDENLVQSEGSMENIRIYSEFYHHDNNKNNKDWSEEMKNYFRDNCKIDKHLENCNIYFQLSSNNSACKVNALSSHIVLKIDLQLFARIHQIIEFFSFSRLNQYIKKYVPKFKPVIDHSLNLSLNAIKAKKLIVRNWLHLAIWSLRINKALQALQSLQTNEQFDKLYDPITFFIKQIISSHHEFTLRTEQLKIFMYDKMKIISMKNIIPNVIIINKSLILNLSENKFLISSSLIHVISTCEKLDYKDQEMNYNDNDKYQGNVKISISNSKVLNNNQYLLNEPNSYKINAIKPGFVFKLDSEILHFISYNEEKENITHNRKHSETERKQSNKNIAKHNEGKEIHSEFYSEEGKNYSFDTFIIIHKQNNSESFCFNINLLKQKIEYFFHFGDSIISLSNNEIYTFVSHFLPYLYKAFPIISKYFFKFDLYTLTKKMKKKEIFYSFFSHFLKYSSILIEHGAIQLKLSNYIFEDSDYQKQLIHKKNSLNENFQTVLDEKLPRLISKDLDIVEMLPSSFQAFVYEDKYTIKAFGISLISHIDPFNSYNKIKFLYKNIKTLFLNSPIGQAMLLNIRMKEKFQIKNICENKSILKHSGTQSKKVRFNLINTLEGEKHIKRNSSPPPKIDIFKENDKQVIINEKNKEDESLNKTARTLIINPELKDLNHSDIFLKTDNDAYKRKAEISKAVKENKLSISDIKVHKSLKEKIIPFSKLYEGIRVRQKKRACKLFNISKKSRS